MIKPGKRVKILAIGKDDACYSDRKRYIGLTGVVDVIGKDPVFLHRKPGGFFFCEIKFNTRTAGKHLCSIFYRVKLKNLEK